MRPIDADELYQSLKEAGMLFALRMVEKAPTIEARTAYGVWQGEGDGYADGHIVYDTWECSECGHEEATDEPELLPSYCPSCGAKMCLRQEGG